MSFIKRAAALIAAAMTTLVMGAGTLACADTYSDQSDTVFSRDGFEVDGTFYGADIGCGELNVPRDMFFTENETLLIADSGFVSVKGTGRIVITNRELKKIRTVERLDFSDMRGWLDGRAAAFAEGALSEELYKRQISEFFNVPTGVFADKELIYVADSGNARVVAFTAGNGVGKVKRVFTLDKDADFTPLKVVVDNLENVFISAEGQDGAAMFTRAGELRGYFGSGEFSNLDIDKKGYIYAVSDSAGSPKKLDVDGNDVFAGADFGRALLDVDVSENGDILLLDETGQLSLYNNELVPLFTFGEESGIEAPAAAENIGGRVYVLDSANNSITAFKPTEFGELFFEAAELYDNGDFESSIEAWQRVLQQDPNSTAAHIGIGSAYLKSGDSKTALEHLKGRSESLYSEAFKQRRRELLRENFTPIALAVIAAGAAVYVLLAIRRKKNAVPLTEKSRTLRVMCRPADGFFELRTENAYHLPTALIILALFAVLTAVSESFAGALRNVILFLMWVTANKAVCTLFGGIGSVKAVFVSSAYSLCPLIIGKTLNLILSCFLASDEKAPLIAVTAVSVIYCLVMLFSGVMETHRYWHGKTFLLMGASILGMGVMIVISAVLITLLERVWLFFRAVFTEILQRCPTLNATALTFIFIGAIAVIVGIVCGAYALYERAQRKRDKARKERLSIEQE